MAVLSWQGGMSRKHSLIPSILKISGSNERVCKLHKQVEDASVISVENSPVR